jgi:hypothetical protein
VLSGFVFLGTLLPRKQSHAHRARSALCRVE